MSEPNAGNPESETAKEDIADRLLEKIHQRKSMGAFSIFWFNVLSASKRENHRNHAQMVQYGNELWFNSDSFPPFPYSFPSVKVGVGLAEISKKDEKTGFKFTFATLYSLLSRGRKMIVSS